jgi:hypothetical protein
VSQDLAIIASAKSNQPVAVPKPYNLNPAPYTYRCVTGCSKSSKP